MVGLQARTVSDERIEVMALEVPVLMADEPGERARQIFEENPEAEGIVVLEHDHPAGIVMRSMFFQKMSSRYGYSLYSKRPVAILMDPGFLFVDAGESISQVGLKATARAQDNLYDYIIIYRQSRYIGVISIRHFFEELSRRNEAQIGILQEQQQQLLMAHQQETHLRTQLERQSAAMRNLMDHAEQGFLWFGKDLMIKREVSYQCQRLFGRQISGTEFLDLMAELFPADRMPIFIQSLESYFANNSMVTDAVYLMLLPTDCQIEGRHLHLQYKRIESGGQKAVMVVVNDVSERVAMERSLEEDRYKQRLLIKAFSAQAQIRRLMEEFRELFGGGYRNFLQEGILLPTGLDELFREVHTYKGDFAQYGFATASQRIHALEDELSALRENKQTVIAPQLEQLFAQAQPEEVLAQDLQMLSEFLGRGFFETDENIAIPRRRLLALEQALYGDTAGDDANIRELFRGLLRKPVKARLSQYGDYVEYLSQRMRKPHPIFLVEGDDVEVEEEAFDRLFRSLVHVFRNCMDHGIEGDEERVQQGKSPRGVIRCEVLDRKDGWFILRILDDGCGLSTEKLKTRALERCIYPREQLEQMDREELCDLVFADNLSTKDQVSSLSGRGMGLAAVREACRSLGGEIHAESHPDQGTCFVMNLPCIPLKQEHAGD